jgi:hypothetical protein
LGADEPGHRGVVPCCDVEWSLDERRGTGEVGVEEVAKSRATHKEMKQPR